MYQVYFYIEKLIVWPIQSYIALNWSFVSKITNLKHQNLPGRDIVWIFEFRLLEIACPVK